MPTQDTTHDTTDELILDLLEWIGPRGRSYAETLDAWKTHCPRLTIWEDATDRGLVVRRRVPELGPAVSVSAAGAAHLRAHRPSSRRDTRYGEESQRSR